jgi:hypothetical protein
LVTVLKDLSVSSNERCSQGHSPRQRVRAQVLLPVEGICNFGDGVDVTFNPSTSSTRESLIFLCTAFVLSIFAPGFRTRFQPRLYASRSRSVGSISCLRNAHRQAVRLRNCCLIFSFSFTECAHQAVVDRLCIQGHVPRRQPLLCPVGPTTP